MSGKLFKMSSVKMSALYIHEHFHAMSHLSVRIGPKLSDNKVFAWIQSCPISDNLLMCNRFHKSVQYSFLRFIKLKLWADKS